MKIFRSEEPFIMESGAVLPSLEIAYDCYGIPDPGQGNVIWVCHALTASSDVVKWWPGVAGPGTVLDPEKYFIVCANILGSCYGTTGPQSIDPLTGEPYYLDFPVPTIRDIVKAHILLRRHLGIERIELLIGGSMGGYQALEWALSEPSCIRRLLLLATSPAESAWGHAIHAAQRMAIEADPTWKDRSPVAGVNGLKAARGIGMLTYRNYEIMVERQKDPDPEKTENFKAESYLRYQGEKLANRFNAHSYWILTKSMDTHNIARGRGGDIAGVLKSIKQLAFIMGITTDILCPPEEQKYMSANMPDAVYWEKNSEFGHDGFLVEKKWVSEAIRQVLESPLQVAKQADL